MNYQKLSWHNLVTSVQKAIHKMNNTPENKHSRVNTFEQIPDFSDLIDDDSEPTQGSAIRRHQKQLDWNEPYVYPSPQTKPFR